MIVDEKGSFPLESEVGLTDSWTSKCSEMLNIFIEKSDVCGVMLA